ncbi:GIY-YIG nuclease family protein [Candidatus Amesbacteria bacterium]|nr:GIY-YIG nuclease family protein [Candidatus Amesbacteria bacterium]
MLQSPSSHHLSSSSWDLLPRVSGVYIYKDKQSKIIYVGKAKNLKSRVSSYFRSPVNLGSKTAILVSQISTIEYIEVNSEIEALLLELKLIKKFMPKYNIASKDDKSPYYIHITKSTYPKPIVNHVADGSIAGPFLSGYIAKSILRQFRKIAPYCASNHPEKPCLYTHLGLCDPNPIQYKKNIGKLRKLLQGEFSKVRTDLTEGMYLASKSQDFESASKFRDKIRNLDYLLLKPVSADDYIVNPNLVEDKRQEALESIIRNLKLEIRNLNRIEMFDISNLSGTSATGAMTVAINGQITPSEYRHFTIHQNEPNDVNMMKEMLTRRLERIDWPRPDLIILDGGMTQLSIVNWNIPTFGLAKQDEIIFDIHGNQIRLERSNPGLQLLQSLRDEAHRFSRRLHHKHRSATIKS